MNVIRTRTVVAACIMALHLYGCATASKDVSPSFVAPLQYHSYDCEQLTVEIKDIQARLSELGPRLDAAANTDKRILGVGLTLFWPALFALGGTKHQEAEYARLRGEYDALGQQMMLKKCDGTSITTTTAFATGAANNATPIAAPAAATNHAPIAQELRPSIAGTYCSIGSTIASIEDTDLGKMVDHWCGSSIMGWAISDLCNIRALLPIARALVTKTERCSLQ